MVGSVHGVTITPYRRSSLTTTATNVSRRRQTSSAPPRRCSCYQAEACCAAGSLGPRGASWNRHIDQCQPRVAGVWHGVRCKVIHVTVLGARRLRSLEPSGWKWWSRFRSWQPAHVLAGAQPECPIRVTTHRFGSSPPPRTTGSIKGRVVGRWEEDGRHSCVSFLRVAPAVSFQGRHRS